MEILGFELSSYSFTPMVILLVMLLLVSVALIAAPPPYRKWQSSLLQLGRRKKFESSEIVALRVYPIKSCRGISIKKTTLQMHGLDLDRQWMFVKAETHEFITIRQIPQMTLVNTGLSEDGKHLLLSITGDKDNNLIRIPAYPSEKWLKENTTLAPVKVWNVNTDGYAYGPEVNAVFSQFLEQDVKLVYKGPTPRILQGNGAPALLGRTQSTYFPDVLPVLIASEASLAELNSRLAQKGENPITIERFRPNIIVKGSVPWSEDSWHVVRLSTPENQTRKPLDVDIVAHCARCRVPNVEPSTAQQHKTEPWNTLMSYRRIDEGIKFKPCFGMLSVPRSEGEIEVGMILEVTAETNKHRYA
jgi:uncharacterized protein YcbX